MPVEIFRLDKTLHAVKLHQENEGEVFTLPVGATIVIRNASSVPGCVEIEYENETFNVFEEDLRERSRAASGGKN